MIRLESSIPDGLSTDPDIYNRDAGDSLKLEEVHFDVVQEGTLTKNSLSSKDYLLHLA